MIEVKYRIRNRYRRTASKAIEDGQYDHVRIVTAVHTLRLTILKGDYRIAPLMYYYFIVHS